MTLREFFKTVYRPLRLRGRSVNTARLYDNLFTQFDRWLAAEKIADEGRIDHLDELLLARYLEHRASTRSPYTAEKERSQLLAIARLAWDRRVPGLDRMPTCPPGILPDRIPTAWTAEELQRLFAAAGKAKGMVGPIAASEWFPATIQLAYETGERIGALLATPAADYRRPTLMVQPEARKGGRRGRVYHLSPGLCHRLDRIVAHGDPRLLPWHQEPTHVYCRLKAVLKAAGLDGKRVAWHQIRRTAISQIAAAGGDPVAFAGHANPSVTKRWYLDPRMAERGPKPHELLPPLDLGDPDG
jgi:site-specific recombinase XerD